MTEMKWIVSHCLCSKSSLICLPRGTNFFLGNLVKCTLWMWYVLSTKKMKYNHASTDPFSRDLCTVWNLCKALEEFFNTQEDIVDILLWKYIFVLICTVVVLCFEPLFYFKTGNYPCTTILKDKLLITSGLKGRFLLLANFLILLVSYGFEHTIVTRINKTCWTWFL